MLVVAVFTCPRCGKRSNHPTDGGEGYCGVCHDWTGTEPPRYGTLPALNMAELGDLEQALEMCQAFLVLAQGPDGTIAVEREAWATVTSLLTAVREARLGARADPLALIASLRQRVEGMGKGDEEYDRTVMRSALTVMRMLVADLHARHAQLEELLPSDLRP